MAMGAGEGFNRLWLHLFIVLLCAATIVQCVDSEICTYKFNVKTGIKLHSGTDSVIGLTLYNSSGVGIRVKDLADWGGTKGPKYDYFEWGNLDEFKGIGPCLFGRPCKIILTSDGSGSWGPGWYCEYVELETSTRKTRFVVNRWLDKKNGLTFVKDNCGKTAREHYWLNVLESVVSDSEQV